MKKGTLPLRDLLRGVLVTEIQGDDGVHIRGLSPDSRRVERGMLFAALVGTKVDGHDFAGEAVRRGALAVLCERPLPLPGRICRVLTEDSRSALARIAERYRGNPSRKLDVVGVTGTNGKTTVAAILRGMLERAGRPTGLLGTVRYVLGGRTLKAERTTPGPVLLSALLDEMRLFGLRGCVMEVSSHALDQRRVEGVRFAGAIFTNLSPEHLDYHAGEEDYLQAKLSLFRRLGRGAFAVVNRDDPRSGRVMGAIPPGVRRVVFSLEGNAEVRATEVSVSWEGTRFRLHLGKRSLPVRCPLLGRHNVGNALAAVSAALSMGVGEEAIAAGLREARPVEGRMERVAPGSAFPVLVDYAHTEAALRAVLSSLRSLHPGRILLVFGCGGERDRTKRPAMGRVAARLADLSFLTSDNPRGEDPEEILGAVLRGFNGSSRPPRVVIDRREAIRACLKEARPGDAVLIAGKGHEETLEIGGERIPFSDRAVAEEILGEGWA